MVAFNDCSVVANIPIYNNGLNGITSDNNTNTIFVAFHVVGAVGGGYVTIDNMAVNNIYSTPTGGYQIGYNPTSGYVFMTDFNNSVYVINGATGGLQQRVIMSNAIPTYVVRDPRTGRSVVVDSNASKISFFAGTSVTNVSVGKDPFFIMPTPGDMYVTHASGNRCAYANGNLSDLTGTTFNRNYSIGYVGTFMAYDSKDAYIYIADQCTAAGAITNNVTVFNTIAQNVVTNIHGISATALAYNPQNNYMYLGEGNPSGVLVLNATTGNFAGWVPLTQPNTTFVPTQILYNPHDHFMYVGFEPSCNINCEDNVTILNGTKFYRNITVGTAPTNITQSAKRIGLGTSLQISH